MKVSELKQGSICGVCAEERGGVWPEGHIATWSDLPCGYCGDKWSASIYDFDWAGDDAYKKLRD